MKRYQSLEEIDSITIETASHCNARCIICPQCYYPRKPYFMPLKTFGEILKMFPNLKSVVLCGLYEPLIDNRLDGILHIIEYEKPKAEISIFTNGSLLTPEKIEILLSHPNLKSIIFSIHGFRKEVYNNVMKGLDRDTTYNRINRFLEVKGKYPKVRVSFVRIAQNIKDLPAFRSYWMERVDEVSDFEVMNWRGLVPWSKLAYETPKYNRFCPMFDWPLVIDAYGNVVRCCYCFDRTYGNVLQGGIENWLRKNPVSNTYPFEDCKECVGWKCY